MGLNSSSVPNDSELNEKLLTELNEKITTARGSSEHVRKYEMCWDWGPRARGDAAGQTVLPPPGGTRSRLLGHRHFEGQQASLIFMLAMTLFLACLGYELDMVTNVLRVNKHTRTAHRPTSVGGAQLLIFRLLSSHYVPSAVTASEGLSHTKGTGMVRGETTGREHVPSGSDEDAGVAQHESCRQRVPDSSGASCEERLKIWCIY